MTAITQQSLKPKDKILAYMKRTGNKHTARELAELMNMDVNLTRRRVTDVARHLQVIDKIKEGARHVAVYQAK